MNFRNQKCISKLLDIELIAIYLTSEFLGIDSERDLFRKLAVDLLLKVERSVFKRRNQGVILCLKENDNISSNSPEGLLLLRIELNRTKSMQPMFNNF